MTDQKMFQNLRVCMKKKKKKASVMNSTVTTQLQILVFHSHRATANTFKKFTAIPPVK